MPSNGLHSNGFSLVRYLIKKKKINLKTNKFLKKELIRPTKIYVKELSIINEKNLIEEITFDSTFFLRWPKSIKLNI